MIRVTFDSNVWEEIVELGEKCPEEYRELRNKIESQEIEPYICEIALSLESIRKKDRLAFYNSYKPRIEIVEHYNLNSQCSGTFSIAPDTSAHPGFCPILHHKINQAAKLGFKVLRMTNLGTARCPDIPPSMFTGIDKNNFWEYYERVSECSNYIADHGWGRAKYEKLKSDYNLMSLSFIKILSKLPPEKYITKEFYEAIAEWADGESLAAHFAYKNDYFCTKDKGRNAGKSSVFHPENLIKVKEVFSLNVIAISELINVL